MKKAICTLTLLTVLATQAHATTCTMSVLFNGLKSEISMSFESAVSFSGSAHEVQVNLQSPAGAVSAVVNTQSFGIPNEANALISGEETYDNPEDHGGYSRAKIAVLPNEIHIHLTSPSPNANERKIVCASNGRYYDIFRTNVQAAQAQENTRLAGYLGTAPTSAQDAQDTEEMNRIEQEAARVNTLRNRLHK